ncbi:hypothetical protein Acy02nite_24580 [Actinoplanes cyaneus]|uniref:Uncharacterized protein n=1 Tax=Actinoplanes cyaneus TaxID=52696 RepID=A0A919IHQ2_9ACTN|nr:hypothetical protein [Actinoplanes cyaneus]GID64577.1 hypothetical protein Acy02nite_24580 [Actinoplanes cyaneus]
MLTILAMIGGYLLNQRQKDSASGSESGSSSSATTPSTDVSSGPPLLATEGTCTWHTQEMARDVGAVGTLSQVLRITTDRGSAVWICQDEVGNLYYHANKGGADAKWVEGQTALFLSGVERQPNGSFQVTARWDGTTFNVNSDRLQVTKKNTTPRVEKAVGG